jgi:NADPH:quinone reductase-like Zn-dependent oxidoreductase
VQQLNLLPCTDREKNVIDELKKNYSSKDARFDVILDSVSEGAIYKQSPHYLKETGHYFNIGASSLSPDMGFFSLVGFLAGAISIMLPWWLGGVARKGAQGGLDKKDMHELARKYVDTGVLSAVIDSEFNFDDTKKAYERIMSNRALGKVVVNVKSD